ncbi:hypothetical protein Ae201684P_015076 [Aphanomyces euteiches]|nr:hypothetical protein Ae201684P_015076 [Aphanomyces euteiches]
MSGSGYSSVQVDENAMEHDVTTGVIGVSVVTDSKRSASMPTKSTERGSVPVQFFLSFASPCIFCDAVVGSKESPQTSTPSQKAILARRDGALFVFKVDLRREQGCGYASIYLGFKLCGHDGLAGFAVLKVIQR